jgi:putative ABC transport system permease protein
VALLVMIARKMVKNKWLEFSLLLGLILSVALVSSMPIYTNAILQRMLIKDLELIQTNSNQYPGSVTIGYSFSDEKPETRVTRLQTLDNIASAAVNDGFHIPVIHFVKERRVSTMETVPVDTSKYDATIKRSADIGTLENLESHIRLLDGRMPAEEQPVNGVYEAVIVQKAIFDLKLAVGAEYVLTERNTEKQVNVKIVGVIDKKDDADIYWNNNNITRYSRTMLIPFDVFERDFSSGISAQIRSLYYNIVLDYDKMKLDNVQDYSITYAWLKSRLGSLSFHHSVGATAFETINLYDEREAKLRTLLWSMNVPVMIMLAFYLYMVSNLIMDRQKTEIAVLRSRGASRLQIMTSFLIEGIALSAIAIAIGPLVGLFLTKILGASNGFLEFVQRSAMEVRLDKTAYQYGAFALGFGLLTMLIPGFLATRISIVGHKQQLARKQKKSIWHTLFLDVILVAISIYGLVTFNRRMAELSAAGLDASQFTIDPLLFVVPTLFTVGCGLLFLRLYPLFIRLVYWIGRKWWPPSLYSTLIQVGRSSTQYQFLMVFLIMTIATGIFSASAARTMNQNNEDKISYKYGADIVMKVQWPNDAPPPPPPGGAQSDTLLAKRVQYVEPAYEPIVRDLPGVESTAKVFVKEKATFSGSNYNGTGMLMAVDTDEFGRTTWFKEGLLPHHINDYLNVIALDPTAVLISRTLADQYSVKPGDQIYLGWDMVEPRTFMVYGILDYFPTYQPNPTNPGTPAPKLIVAHLSAVQSLLAVEPYQIWMKTSEDADRQALVEELKERKIPIEQYVDVRSEIIKVKNDPFQLAVNGVMTLGFIIAIIVSFCGFLLYWILSLHGRILQIGIFRAMGISFRQLVFMLIAEQLLTSGAGIVIGLINGNITSNLFVKFFQLSFNPATQVPPFEVIFDPRDTTGMFIIVTLMIGLGLAILAYLLSRIKIHQAVKLGED